MQDFVSLKYFSRTTCIVNIVISLIILTAKRPDAMSSSPNSREPATIMVFIPYDKLEGKQSASVPVVAIESIRQLQLLDMYDVDFVWYGRDCNKRTAIKAIVDYSNSSGTLPAAIFGVSCNDVCEVLSQMTSALDIVFISHACTTSSLNRYPDSRRIAYVPSDFVPVIISVLLYFRWYRIAVMTSQNLDFQLAREALMSQAKNITMFFYSMNGIWNTGQSNSLHNAESILTEIKTKALSKYFLTALFLS